MRLTYQFIISLLLIVGYYSLFKKLLRYPVKSIASFFHLTKQYSVEEAKGAVGFVLVTFSHLLFVILVIKIFSINFSQLGFESLSSAEFIYGSMLGLGLAGTTLILSLCMVKCCVSFSPYSENQMMFALPGGWLKSYEYLKRVTPWFIFLPAIILQLACEEIIFRSIFLNYYAWLGMTWNVIISTFLFAFMQIFQMPTVRSSLFPVLGAIIMGVVHGYLFLLTHSVWPFIISHCIFFLLFTL